MAECTMCGACCVAPDISAIGKKIGQPCPNLMPDNSCGVYENRPQICRDYDADELCERIDAPTLAERVKNYLDIFGFDITTPSNVR